MVYQGMPELLKYIVRPIFIFLVLATMILLRVIINDVITVQSRVFYDESNKNNYIMAGRELLPRKYFIIKTVIFWHHENE